MCIVKRQNKNPSYTRAYWSVTPEELDKIILKISEFPHIFQGYILAACARLWCLSALGIKIPQSCTGQSVYITIPPLDTITCCYKYLKIQSYHCLSVNEANLTWWRHQMETFSALLAICAGNSLVLGEFPAQRPVTRSFDAFFDLRLNKRLSKQWWGWWFELLLRPLWRHRNVRNMIQYIYIYPYWTHNATQR